MLALGSIANALAGDVNRFSIIQTNMQFCRPDPVSQAAALPLKTSRAPYVGTQTLCHAKRTVASGDLAQ
jgi:hypothetical protein